MNLPGVTGMRHASVIRVPVDPATLASTPDLAGVDLDLDVFNLSTPIHVEGCCVEDLQSAQAQSAIGRTFWDSLSGSTFKDDDVKLLNDLFNPCLSDRRQEGMYFIPPE